MSLWPFSPKRDCPPTLRTRLTLQMIVVQLLTLAGFGALVLLILTRFESDSLTHPATIDAVSHSIDREDGRLVLRPTPELVELIAAHPDLWFHVIDATGQSLSQGNPPAALLPLLPALNHVNRATLGRADLGDETTAMMLRSRSEAGPVWIAAGGGPVVAPLYWGFRLVKSWFGALGLLLSLVTVVAIPLMIRRSLRGLGQVAAAAAQIEGDRRGTRLPLENVPGEIQPVVTGFNQALARLDEGLERRQRFLGDAAHELRTPIAVLATRIQLMPPSELRERLLLDAGRLATLADNLLDLQRLDSDTTRMLPLELNGLVGEITSDIAPLVISARREITFDPAPGPVRVLGDRQSLVRVISNLIQNALTHAECDNTPRPGGMQGGVAGGVLGRIEVVVDRPAVIRVRDNGPGIPLADRERLFEPFYRLAPQSQGAGLGLHLARDIVVRHGGTIHVTEAPGGGAEFVVRLPLAEPA